MAGHTMLSGVQIKKKSSSSVKTTAASKVIPKRSEISISKSRGLIIDSGPPREVKLAINKTAVLPGFCGIEQRHAAQVIDKLLHL